MTKRDFLKSSGAILSASMLPTICGAETPEMRTNWSGNYRYQARRLLTPASPGEIGPIIRNESRIKALGARHSFNGIADSSVAQISLEHFQDVTIDAAARAVTVGAGVRYGAFAPELHARGFAVHNLASLPHISVVGACATATHGSGVRNGNLSTAVRAFEFVDASGTGQTLSRDRDGDRFAGAVAHLGALGVISKITLDLQPAFEVQQVVYEDLPMERLASHLDEILSSGYSVSLFTDWQNHRITQVWIKSRVEQGALRKFPPDFLGAKLATRNLHPLKGHSAENCTEQLGVPGPWYERLPHFRMNFTPSSGQELQTEYFVPLAQGYEAILAVERLKDHIGPYLFISELRAIAADDLWMSPCHQRASLAIHFTWKPDWPAVRTMLPRIEAQLAPFHPRPHWAKLFSMPSDTLRAEYPRLTDFHKLARDYDPGGKFRNEFLEAHLYSPA